jgi:hypothetical protein
MSGTKDPTPMPRGYVALLDVLGFSAFMTGDGEGEHLQRYLKCLRDALDDEAVGPIVDYVVFSDSIVLTTKDDSDVEFQALLRRCSRALGLMLQNEIALRGAISHGSFFRAGAANGIFVAGRAILDAYKFETAQDWVGIMLAPSTIKRAPDLIRQAAQLQNIQGATEEQQAEIRRILPAAAFVQPCRNIPFHSNQPFDYERFDGFAVVPTDGVAEPSALSESTERSYRALEWLGLIAPSPSAQAKYQRSLQWVYEVWRRWQNIAHWEKRLRDEK